MKKLYFSIIFSLLGFSISAQSMEKGNTMLDIGAGFGAYGTKFKLNGNTTTDGAVPAYFDINSRYAITDNIALGVNVDIGSYVRDEEDRIETPGDYRYSKIAGSFRYLFVNTDAFQFFTDANFGYARTTFSGDFFDHCSGFIYQLNGGINIYFADFIGLYVTTGYSSYVQNGKISDSDLEFQWIFKGFNAQSGLTFKF